MCAEKEEKDVLCSFAITQTSFPIESRGVDDDDDLRAVSRFFQTGAAGNRSALNSNLSISDLGINCFALIRCVLVFQFDIYADPNAVGSVNTYRVCERFVTLHNFFWRSRESRFVSILHHFYSTRDLRPQNEKTNLCQR